MLRGAWDCQFLIDSFLTDTDSKAKKTQYDIQLNKSISSISLSPKDLKYKDKKIRHLTLMGYFKNSPPVADDPNYLAATRVLVEFMDGSHALLQFKEPLDCNQFALSIGLEKAGGIIESAFLDHGKGTVNKKIWEEEKLPYTPNQRIFYDTTHQAIANSLLDHIQKNPHFLQKAKDHGVYLISLGCGDGKDMDVCSEKLRLAKLNYCTVGIDSSATLIEANKKRNSSHQFIHADILKINEILPTLPMDEKLVVYISSGSFARTVFAGSNHVLQAMHQIFAEGIGDILIAGGLTDLLITRQGAASSGWGVKPFNYYYPNEITTRQLFVCARQSYAEEFATMLERSKVRSKDPKIFSTLDLSMTACPLKHMRTFLEKEPALVQQVTQIDLSWSQIAKEEISLLLELFSKFKNITHVTISCYEPWAADFKTELTENLSSFSFKLLKRKDSTCANELPTISVSDCKKLGIYKTLPNETILEGTARQFGNECKEPDVARFHLPKGVSLGASQDMLFSMPDGETASPPPQSSLPKISRLGQ